MSLLRRTLGSLPVVPVATEIPVEVAMTERLKEANTLPAKLSISEKIKKADLIYDDGEVRFNKEDRLNNDEMVSMLLDQGRQVCALGVHVDTQCGLDLELTRSCKFKKFQFGEAFSTQNKAEEDALSREYADFILMVDELRTAYTLIFDALGKLQAPRE
ncbi:hypothetical protein XSR1_870004 [Xenorhabdus szentirmaii DSM 16338]|uniref:Recombination-associated protein RdgC n=1 Tax=Xenorhabdus szentirmaii DSM 16338 TaxID=1427518 RepID=W1J4E0_9GAMM|nr:recombination associated protein [Xenorhabdus szentirmaii DSM 16338]CDL85632.1 hypothetical protein XSR1_870004 [Xenorhabdus szentirmaii DSM 16338]